MSFSGDTKFERCPECGGWVPFRRDEEDGVWKQSSACRPCWKIKSLREMLAQGAKVSQGESADTLREKLRKAEAEVERRTRERDRARTELRETRGLPRNGVIPHWVADKLRAALADEPEEVTP